MSEEPDYVRYISKKFMGFTKLICKIFGHDIQHGPPMEIDDYYFFNKKCKRCGKDLTTQMEVEKVYD